MPNEISNLSFGDLTLDRRVRQLCRGAEVLPVTGKAFDLLAYMAANAGRPLLKAELLEAVWPDSFVEESNLSQNVFLLRKALGADAAAIVTLPGRGYQFAAQIRETPDAPAVPLTSALEATRTRILVEEETEEHIAPWRSPWVLSLSGIGVVLLVVAGYLGYQRWQDRVGGPPVQVVLTDFDGSTGDPVLDHALVDALRIDLSQSPFVNSVSAALTRQTLAQMQHKPDEPLTPDLARDLCERTASQAVLHGSIARAGSRLLLTEEATNCKDGSVIASAKSDAVAPEDLPHSLDRLASALRGRLGESRRTLARFDTPLIAANTASLDALKDYSQALSLSQHGKMTEAIGLLKQAVIADPTFAPAYLDMANFYANLGDYLDQDDSLTKAYALRGNALAPQRFYIEARYHSQVDGDLYQSLHDYRDMAAVYPRNAAALSGELDMDRQLGHWADGAEVARRAVTLAPNYISLYYGLCAMRMHAGQLGAANEACHLAIARGFDGDLIRATLFQIAVVQNDSVSLAEQRQWGGAHLEARFLALQICLYDLSQGRVAASREELIMLTTALHHAGLDNLAMTYTENFAGQLAMLGDAAGAQSLIHPAAITAADPDGVEALYRSGLAKQAISLLNGEMARRPHATGWHDYFLPVSQAWLALDTDRPSIALDALAPEKTLPSAAYDVVYLRGRAQLASNQPAAAEASFREELAEPFVKPITVETLLGWIGLCQALTAQHKAAEAQSTWQHVQALYSNADPGVLAAASRVSATHAN